MKDKAWFKDTISFGKSIVLIITFSYFAYITFTYLGIDNNTIMLNIGLLVFYGFCLFNKEIEHVDDFVKDAKDIKNITDDGDLMRDLLKQKFDKYSTQWNSVFYQIMKGDLQSWKKLKAKLISIKDLKYTHSKAIVYFFLFFYMITGKGIYLFGQDFGYPVNALIMGMFFLIMTFVKNKFDIESSNLIQLGKKLFSTDLWDTVRISVEQNIKNLTGITESVISKAQDLIKKSDSGDDLIGVNDVIDFHDRLNLEMVTVERDGNIKIIPKSNVIEGDIIKEE